jgi:starch synthase
VSQPNPTGDRLKVALCTREYPPEVYGGAGVHVEYLAKELSKHVDLTHLQALTTRPPGQPVHLPAQIPALIMR